jgi:23S rRNA (uracil1939-C5)-methyltransferase
MSTPDRPPVLITELDWRARGVARTEDYVHRIRGALPGERITLSAGDRPRILDVAQASTHRRAVDCEQAIDCPGCQLRHTSSQFAVDWRAERVSRDLSALALNLPPWRLLGSAPRDSYRVRAVVHAVNGTDSGLRLGMRSGDRTIDLGRCPVQSPQCRTLITRIEQDLRRVGLRAYDPESREGEIRHVVVDGPVECGDQEPSVDPQFPRARVTLCFGRPVEFEGLAAKILVDQDDVALAADILPFRSPSLFARPVSLRGGLAIDMRVDTDWLRATLPAWTPQTPETVPVVMHTMMEWLAPKSTERVLEVGCGVGTNSLAIARTVEELVGVDSSRAAIDDAVFNADRAGLPNCQFRVGEAAKSLSRVWSRHGDFDAVVMHAMRRPFGPRAMAVISQMRPSRIIYLGPSARSMTEDLSGLPNYSVTDLGGVDQSPGTTGMLTMCRLTLQTP